MRKKKTAKNAQKLTRKSGSAPNAASQMAGAGGGEVARYIGRHGTPRVAKAALIAADAEN